MKRSILSTRFVSGTTALDEALELADEEFSEEFGARLNAAHPVAIVFTDGYSFTDPVPAATKLHGKGIVVYAVGINKYFPLNRRELARVAGDPARVYTDENFADFQQELQRLTRDCA